MNRPFPLARVCVMAILVIATTSAAIAQPLDVVIEQFRVRGKLKTSTVGYVVVDLQTGEELAAHNPTDLFIPASNQKLMTSVAALQVLGPGFEFITSIGYDEASHTLVIEGAGDPAFGDPKLLQNMSLAVEDFVEAIVGSIVSAGVPSGAELVLDDRIFDRDFVHPTWPKGQLNRWYCAEVSGLTFHTNTISIFAEPSQNGRPPNITLEPNASWLDIDSRKSRSVSSGRHTLWAARQHMTNDISLRGDSRYASTPVEVTVHEPAMFVGNLLAQELEKAGIGPSAVRLAQEGEHFDNLTPIQNVRTTLATALERTNTDSHNLYAESLLKRMGREITGEPGSWRNGCTVVRMVARELTGAISGKDLVVADGSGMSRENRVTPETLVRMLLAASREERLFEPLRDSLATPGRGTLRTRFRDGSVKSMVYAKSGYLKGVSALSGYVIDQDTGRGAAFSIILNDVPSSVARSWVKEFEEGTVKAIDAYLRTGEPGSVLGPR